MLIWNDNAGWNHENIKSKNRKIYLLFHATSINLTNMNKLFEMNYLVIITCAFFRQNEITASSSGARPITASSDNGRDIAGGIANKNFKLNENDDQSHSPQVQTVNYRTKTASSAHPASAAGPRSVSQTARPIKYDYSSESDDSSEFSAEIFPEDVNDVGSERVSTARKSKRHSEDFQVDLEGHDNEVVNNINVHNGQEGANGQAEEVEVVLNASKLSSEELSRHYP